MFFRAGLRGRRQTFTDHAERIGCCQALSMPYSINWEVRVTEDSSFGLLSPPAHHSVKFVNQFEFPVYVKLFENSIGASLTINPVIVTIFVKQVHVLEPFLKGPWLFEELKNFVLPKLLLHNITTIPIFVVFWIKGTALVLQNAFALVAVFALDGVVDYRKLDILFYFQVVVLEVPQEDIVVAVSSREEKSDSTFCWFFNRKVYFYFGIGQFPQRLHIRWSNEESGNFDFPTIPVIR